MRASLAAALGVEQSSSLLVYTAKQYIAMKHSDASLSRELKKGSTEFLVLSLLSGRPRHGYEIGRLIEERSDGKLVYRIASLYPLLCRLEERGLITGRWVEKAGERRR